MPYSLYHQYFVKIKLRRNANLSKADTCVIDVLNDDGTIEFYHSPRCLRVYAFNEYDAKVTAFRLFCESTKTQMNRTMFKVFIVDYNQWRYFNLDI